MYERIKDLAWGEEYIAIGILTVLSPILIALWIIGAIVGFFITD